MGGMKRVAVAVVLLALIGAAACGGDEPEPGIDVPPWAKVAPEQIAEAKKHGVPVAFENDLGMRFVLIPAGTFLMGSPDDEEGRDEEEIQHEVTITKPYYMQITEVTNRHYRQLREQHDSGAYKGRSLNMPEQPVVRVSWSDASGFAADLTVPNSRRAYRLPTEAEWEYACRADTPHQFWWGVSEERAGQHANVWDRTAVRELGDERGYVFDTEDGYAVSAPVGVFRPSPWGLYDVLGNVWEWCSDWYANYPQEPVVDPNGPTEARAAIEVFAWRDLADKTHEYKGPVRLARGGSWITDRPFVRVAHRDINDPTCGTGQVGFRLVSPLPEK